MNRYQRKRRESFQKATICIALAVLACVSAIVFSQLQAAIESIACAVMACGAFLIGLNHANESSRWNARDKAERNHYL